MKKVIFAIVLFSQLFVLLPNTFALDQRQIPNWTLVPAVPFIGWCVPTTKTMIFGFWDNAYPEMGYGRLVNFWFNHPKYKVNVPSIVDIMFDRYTGKGKNAEAQVLVNAVNQACGYQFTLIESNSNASNNWSWELIKREIRANRPVLWAFNVGGNTNTRHAVVGIGYREIPGRNKVIVLDSNGGENIHTRMKEYDYNLSYRVECYIPRGGTLGSNLKLLSPNGGERIRSHYQSQIVWYVWGTAITNVAIMCSLDGGVSWFPLTNRMPAHQGNNVYTWVSNYNTHHARIYVAGYANNGAFIAGDGSRNNFTFLSQ
jgi:hypothetical protein